MKKHLPFLFFACILAAGGGYLGYVLRAPDTAQLTGLPQTVHITTPLGGDFSLIRHDRQPVTNADFYGKYTLIYFGYSYCPDVCSTSLVAMLQAINALPQAQQEKITPLFISVDPVRDTPEELASYVADFDPRLVGLTGSEQQIQNVKRLYKVFSQITGEQEDIDKQIYLVNHSSFFYLLNPDGSFAQMFSAQISPENFRNNLQKIVHS